MKNFLLTLICLCVPMMSFAKLATDEWLAPYKTRLEKNAKAYDVAMMVYVWDRETPAPMDEMILKAQELINLCDQTNDVMKNQINSIVANSIVNPEYKSAENYAKVLNYLKASEYGNIGLMYLYVNGNSMANLKLSDVVQPIEFTIKLYTVKEFVQADKLTNAVIGSLNELDEATAKTLLKSMNRRFSLFLLTDRTNWEPIVAKIRTVLATY